MKVESNEKYLAHEIYDLFVKMHRHSQIVVKVFNAVFWEQVRNLPEDANRNEYEEEINLLDSIAKKVFSNYYIFDNLSPEKIQKKIHNFYPKKAQEKLISLVKLLNSTPF